MKKLFWPLSIGAGLLLAGTPALDTLAAVTTVAGVAADGAAYSAAYPDPDRFAGDIAAFAAADSLSPPPPGETLCIGSSSMRMWGPTIARDLAPLTVVPRGFGGSTMYDVLHFAGRIVLPCQPGTILLYEGDNDIDFGVTPEEFLATFRAFVAVVHRELPDTKIYVLSIKPSGTRWHKWPAMRTANELLTAECAADPGLTYIDVATPMLGQDGSPREELFLPDRLHMNATGYEVWTREVRETMLAGRPTACPNPQK